MEELLPAIPARSAQRAGCSPAGRHLPGLLACGGGFPRIDFELPKWGEQLEGVADSGWYSLVVQAVGTLQALLVLIALGAVAAGCHSLWRWLRARDAGFSAARDPELEGADVELRLAHAGYVALAEAIARHRWPDEPAALLARADALAASGRTRAERALARLAPERAAAVRRMLRSVDRIRERLLDRAERLAAP